MTDPTQLRLLDPPRLQRRMPSAHALRPARHLARRTDPDTSHEAAAEVSEKVPERVEILRRVLSRSRNPVTYRELYSRIELTEWSGQFEDNKEIMRRLNDARRLGLVRTAPKRECGVSGRRCQTWTACRTS